MLEQRGLTRDEEYPKALVTLGKARQHEPCLGTLRTTHLFRT